MCSSSAALLILLVSRYFLISIAWIEEKEKVKSADDWPTHGPWIVSVGM